MKVGRLAKDRISRGLNVFMPKQAKPISAHQSTPFLNQLRQLHQAISCKASKIEVWVVRSVDS